MKIIFASQNGRTNAVIWQKDLGLIMARVMFNNGTVEDQVCDSGDMRSAANEWSGSYSAVHVAELDDLQSAFKYLGKASELSETLPEVNFYDSPSSDS